MGEGSGEVAAAQVTDRDGVVRSLKLGRKSSQKSSSVLFGGLCETLDRSTTLATEDEVDSAG